MKFKTFRTLLLGVAVLAVGGGIAGACLTCKGDDKAAPSASSNPLSTAASSHATSTQPPKSVPAGTASGEQAPSGSPSSEGTLRPLDEQILKRIHEPMSGDKVKDAFPGDKAKVSLYQDSGKTSINRLKIDLNRNDKWEEKWTIESEGGKEKIKRQVAPNDDESYSVEYRLVEGKWARK